jgi:S1-C subfamily serine protease
MGPALSTEDIAKNANAAVLFLSGSQGTGSGFLVSDTGVAVTNAHVARGQDTLTATTGNGQSFQSKVVYVDPSLDIALLKLEGSGFPQLRLALTQTVQPGSSVVAIGSPSKGFQNSVTKGIVSGLGPMKSEPGLWIQTDTAINPGNSGGPLLNGAGDVVGITTQKQFLSGDGRPLQGIGFALSSSDLLVVLQKFFPNITQVQVSQEQHRGKGHVSVVADEEGADIYIDGKFVGNAPATFTLASGPHKIEVKDQSGGIWSRDLEVLEDSDVKLSAKLLKK